MIVEAEKDEGKDAVDGRSLGEKRAKELQKVRAEPSDRGLHILGALLVSCDEYGGVVLLVVLVIHAFCLHLGGDDLLFLSLKDEVVCEVVEIVLDDVDLEPDGVDI